jgi:redox-sensitive bicupin YhaK (pirin superfamily)
MIRIRKARERGHADRGWLQTAHTFSFADYYDPRFMGFRTLRVINDDRVAPAMGFPTHPHRDMEIVSYVVEGALEHRDSMGNGSVIRPGDVQKMSAGTGVTHSEFNPSETEPVRLLQIWIVPSESGLRPDYQQEHFPESERRGRLKRVASPAGLDGGVTLNQDASVHASLLDAGDRVKHELAPGRGAWIQVVRGRIAVGDVEAEEGDGIALEDVSTIEISGEDDSELLLFDLA